MPATRVQSRWNAGQLEFLDMNGNVICTFNGTAREFNFPATGILSIGGVPVTATAAELNTVSAAISVRNATGGPLTAGTLVYLSGYHAASGDPTVAAAGLTAQATHVLTEDIADGANGTADEEVLIGGLNTGGTAIGDFVWLDAAGAFAFAVPTGADEIAQLVGVVVTVDGVTGSILFFPGYPIVQRVGTSQIQNNAITEAKIVAGAVTEARLAAPTTVGLGAMRVARIPFTDLTVATHASGVEIPANALIVGGIFHVTTGYTDVAAAALVSFQAEGAEDLLADVGVASLTPANTLVDLIPVGTAATTVRTSVARDISMRIAGADCTAGAGVLYLYYVVTG